jgi:hypothetical protein
VEKQKLPGSALYVKYFGILGHQATINSVTAHLDSGTIQEITLAWLYKDTKRLDDLTDDSSSKRDQISAALGAASKELWSHEAMQKYREMQVVRELHSTDHQESA